MISKSISAVVGLGFLAMSSAQAALVDTVTLTDVPINVNVGDPVTIHVDAWGFTTPTSGGALGVFYDSNVLNLVSANPSAGSPFSDAFLVGTDVYFYVPLVTPDPDPSGDFSAFDLNFTVKTLDPTFVSLIDEQNTIRGWFDSNGDAIPGIEYAPPVPLPAAIWMMLGGMGLLGWTARRRA